ncbi:MAG: twin-arginine translocase TatA/TatE family subunit [FCB group bacterium]|nr:twin-arginine translocase TatA/TatE family subunit [FCB group bacterium]
MSDYQVSYAIFNLGPGEIVLIMLVILLLFGAKRLPELARGLGQGIREFKGAVEGAKQEIDKAAKTPVEPPKSTGTDSEKTE